MTINDLGWIEYHSPPFLGRGWGWGEEAKKNCIVICNAAIKDYAYLYDRVKINSGQLQMYGTQMRVDTVKMTYEPKPVKDPDKLNERRKQVGLSPIEDYIKMMNENFLRNKK